ncbi:flagellar hook-associated protein FlgK [Erwinia aphidicola]|uniref:flagellar hook-associated protein FlgK n=1 Tax=Erwinia aphidicola TaxID=68334 RepID=UPI003D200E1A
MNLFNLAKSGLSTAHSALYVIGNNINNAPTAGYSRRDLIIGEAGGLSTGNGFYGYGAQANGVYRNNDSFLNGQVRGANTNAGALIGRYEQLAEIDNMMGNSEANPSVSLNNFFAALKTLDNDPSDPAARQAGFNTLGSVSYQFNTTAKRLSGLEKSTNSQIEQSVKEINDATTQLAKLNEEIEKITSQHGTPPGDLLDARDNLLTQLSGQMGIQVTENKETGRTDVAMADGRPLVSGNRSYPLQAAVSDANPNKTVVSYVDSSGNAKELNEERFTAGKLGGLFKFRNEDLSKARNELNQMALQMAGRFNEVNGGGFDANGAAGDDLFKVPDPTAFANRNNSGGATLNVTLTKPYSAVQAEDYTITMGAAGNWEVKGADGRVVPSAIDPASGELTFDGLSVGVSGTPAPGDSFMLNPASGVAENLDIAITSGDEIAAAGSPTGGESDNKNLALLLGIQGKQLIGKATLTEAYSSLVSAIGSSTSSLKADLKTADSVLKELGEKWQSVVGVNIEEEGMKLQMFTQYYNANAQILKTATTLFDALLAIR